ncbi:1-deoxy-D-xylulose-5-phosphate synthase N-terminal domain-containing protein, partial [Helicobacter pylori]|uniref:1-deoxy-D-xylulose-5-phosphate synthase N-terminal domain-containing protein n=1 Tax=Helicobacter pylori TaxID=210 RepID=UPI0009C9160D
MHKVIAWPSLFKDFHTFSSLVCQTLRSRILEVVSANGGHLSSSLGAVELIVGMHALFDCQKNPFIFDTSHQAYAHKLLTGG